MHAQLVTARGVAEKSPGKPLADIFFEMGSRRGRCPADRRDPARTCAFERIDPQKLEAIEVHQPPWACRTARSTASCRCGTWATALVVGVVQVDDLVLLDELRHKIGQSIKPVVVTRATSTAVVEAQKADESQRHRRIDGRGA